MSRLRLITMLQEGTRTIKVYRNTEWNEYVAQHWFNGQHLHQDDAHDDDKESILGTAAAMLKYKTPNQIQNQI